jgi:hypothetical protein
MPEWFTKLPWWVRLPLILGGSLSSAFSGSLPAWLQPLGLYAGISLAGIGAGASIWHWLNDRRSKQGKKRLSLEPIYLATFGLVVAIVGVGWQISRGFQTADVVAAPPTELAKPPMKQMLTAYDVEQRQRAIDELYGILGKDIMTVSAAGERLHKMLSSKIQEGTAVTELTKYADDTERALTGYFEIAGRYQIFPDIYHDATSLVWNPFEVVSSSRNLVAELRRLDARGDKAMTLDYLQHNKFLADFNSGTSGRFWTWISEKQQLLTSKRREYEAAAVYPK